MKKSFSVKAVQDKAKELRGKVAETGITPQTNRVLAKIPGSAIKAWYEDLVAEAKEGWIELFGRSFTEKDEDFIYDKVLEAVAIEGMKADDSDIYRAIGRLKESESEYESAMSYSLPNEAEVEESLRLHEGMALIQEQEEQHLQNLADLSESDLVWSVIDLAKEMIKSDGYSIDDEDWKYEMFDRYQSTNTLTVNDLYLDVLDDYADLYAAVAAREGLDIKKRKDASEMVKLDVIKTTQNAAARQLADEWERLNPDKKAIKKEPTEAKRTFKKGW